MSLDGELLRLLVDVSEKKKSNVVRYRNFGELKEILGYEGSVESLKKRLSALRDKTMGSGIIQHRSRTHPANRSEGRLSLRPPHEIQVYPKALIIVRVMSTETGKIDLPVGIPNPYEVVFGTPTACADVQSLVKRGILKETVDGGRKTYRTLTLA